MRDDRERVGSLLSQISAQQVQIVSLQNNNTVLQVSLKNLQNAQTQVTSLENNNSDLKRQVDNLSAQIYKLQHPSYPILASISGSGGWSIQLEKETESMGIGL